jgi:hypothetical protein
MEAVIYSLCQLPTDPFHRTQLIYSCLTDLAQSSELLQKLLSAFGTETAD